MGKFLKLQEKERMKRAMLGQEETFRQQVLELHRLYRAQKQLMKEMKISKLKKHWMPKTMDLARQHGMLNLELPADAYIEYNDKDIEQESQVVLTLATGGSGRRKREETCNTSDSAGSFSSSSVESKVQEMICLAAHSERKNGFDIELRMRQEMLQHPHWLLPCLSLSMS